MNPKLLKALTRSFPKIDAIIGHWEKIGFEWEATSKPILIEKDNEIIAHAGVVEIAVRMDGKDYTFAGIHAVCVLPEFRNRGYGKEVFKKALEATLQYDNVILFTEIPAFYHAFKIVDQFIFKLDYAKKEFSSPLTKLRADNLENINLLKERIKNSKVISETFCFYNIPNILMFNFIGEYPIFSCCYYSEKLNAVLVYEIKDSTLILYDVLADQKYAQDEILEAIPERYNGVEFHFPPEKWSSKEKAPGYFMALYPEKLTTNQIAISPYSCC